MLIGLIFLRENNWPKFPRVESKDNVICIIFEDGRMHIWGKEEDPVEREHIINDIQEGLRAIQYLYISLNNVLDVAKSFLVSRGFSQENIVEYQSDAIMKLTKEEKTEYQERIKEVYQSNFTFEILSSKWIRIL